MNFMDILAWIASGILTIISFGFIFGFSLILIEASRELENKEKEHNH